MSNPIGLSLLPAIGAGFRNAAGLLPSCDPGARASLLRARAPNAVDLEGTTGHGATASRRASQDCLNGLVCSLEFGQLTRELLAPGPRNPIKAYAPVGFRDAPIARHPAIDEHLLKSRI